MILTPSTVVGPGDWHRSSTQIFKYIWDQKNYYTDGLVNYVDVRDVAEIAFRLTIDELQGERFIVNAGHISYKDFFGKIAGVWQKKPPQTLIKPWQSRLFWNMSRVYTFFTGQKPFITRETANIANQKFKYSSSKLFKSLDYSFYSLEDSLEWTCEHLRKKHELAGKT